MILVYTSQQTSRLTYVFKQLFEEILGIDVGFTNTVDAFVAYEGPKFNYAASPFGEGFFVEAHPLLFEHGINPQEITFSKWNGLPTFFQTSKKSKLPFDIFAASFYLLTRYEEHLPYVKNDQGQFDPQQSSAVQGGFLALPLVDLWAEALYVTLQEAFPSMPPLKKHKTPMTPLFQVNNPFRFKHKSILGTLIESAGLLWNLNLKSLLQQLLVVTRVRKDPHEEFPGLLKDFSDGSAAPVFFFSFSHSSDDPFGISPFNKRYQSFVKHVADYAKTFLLIQAPSYPLTADVSEQKEGLVQLIHRTINAVRIKNGLQHHSTDYEALAEQKFTLDYSMGYATEVGFRASTAVPFYYFNLKEEYQTPLQIVPVVASTTALQKHTAAAFTKQLSSIQEQEYLTAAQLFCACTLEDLNFNNIKKQSDQGILNYFSGNATTESR